MQHTQSLCENNRFRYLYRRGKTASAPSLAGLCQQKPAEDWVSAPGHHLQRQIRRGRAAQPHAAPHTGMLPPARGPNASQAMTLWRRPGPECCDALFPCCKRICWPSLPSWACWHKTMKNLILQLIRFYRRHLSGLKRAPTCRFIPTCSQYAIEAIEKYGVCKGGALALRRVLRCNPFCKGGYDPVP